MELKKILIAAVLAAGMAFQTNAADIPRKEYPRPQFERTAWVNLNGEWDYTFDFSNSGMEQEYHKATSFSGKITVPFCPESSLSGVGHKDFINHIWYHREISIPQDWSGKNVLLNFGAVYYNSEIYIDGALAGRHFGGSSSFSIDITKLVTSGKVHHLVVRASSDLRSGMQSAGKQSLPEGLIVYTEDKNGKREEYTCDGDTPISIPLVVLVNENTASAAEIFTGAVKDYGIGTIVGTTTFGKGIVQNTFQLSDGSVVKLTIAHYYTPLGNDIHKVGITPDVEVELPDDATSDVQLEKALEVVKGLESAE